MTTPLIELRGVRQTYGAFTALDRLHLSLPDTAATLAIAGESGSGKTTLARIMLGFIKPSEGQVLYRGKDIATMTRTERFDFGREVQPIFQDPFNVFNPFYRVDHVLTTPLRKFGLASGADDARAKIEDALSRVGLRPKDTLGRFPHELSGGQRQRIMVARAVLLRPRLIVADEPVSMVDASLRATILDEIRDLNRDLGIAFVYITHDLTTAFQLCDDIVVLYQGRVAEAGAVEHVIGAPQHPYSQLLVSSIPLPDLSRRWGDDDLQADPAQAARTSAGCRFAPRCPQVMDRCWSADPTMTRPLPHRMLACHLDASAALQGNDVATVFSGQARPKAATASGQQGTKA
jgi:oligopeptide/dipeptide ABC transporter ATP-binding protein